MYLRSLWRGTLNLKRTLFFIHHSPWWIVMYLQWLCRKLIGEWVIMHYKIGINDKKISRLYGFYIIVVTERIKNTRISSFHLPVSLWRRRSGVAYLIWGTLQEFIVLLKRISASSLNSFGSFFSDWGRVMEQLSDIVGRIISLNWTLSKHWLISEIHAAFSCMVDASRWTDT